MNNYTTLELSNESTAQTAILPAQSNHIERILLILIACIGILGSSYLFAANSSGSPTPDINALSASFITASVDDEEEELKERFKDFVNIEGKKKVGEAVMFSFKKDIHEKRYVMEMGNGHRMIITSNEFPFIYDKPGKYVLELKTIEKGLITTVATKKIKIKG